MGDTSIQLCVCIMCYFLPLLNYFPWLVGVPTLVMFSFPLFFAGLIIAQLKVIMMNKPNYLELDSPSLIPTECNHVRYTLVVCVSV